MTDNPTIDFTPRLRLAADYIAQHGWTQGTERDVKGAVCLTGAIRFCAPQNGDEHIIRAVLVRKDRAEEWNDEVAQSSNEVVGFLRSAEITDSDLEGTFGPQWLEFVALVRRAASLTGDEDQRLGAARDAARGAAWDAARDAAWDAARDAARDAPRGAAWGAAWVAAWDAAWGAAWDAARGAALALICRDLISEETDWNQNAYNVLTDPWATTIGNVHSDDRDRLVTG